MQDSHTAEQRREMMSVQNGETSGSSLLNDSSNSDQIIDVESQSQRLPGTLEQIRALADNNLGNFGAESSNLSTPTTNVDPNQPPKRTGGKPKKYSCKQCGQISTTKEDNWKHSKTHIPIEKQLACTEPGCDFVTEYKHHLQYHLR